MLDKQPEAWQEIEVRSRLRRTERLEQERLARDFVGRIQESPNVVGVWAARNSGLDVTVVVSERDLEAELRFYAIFRELSAPLSDPTMGDLAVVLAPYRPDDAELLYGA